MDQRYRKEKRFGLQVEKIITEITETICIQKLYYLKSADNRPQFKIVTILSTATFVLSFRVHATSITVKVHHHISNLVRIITIVFGRLRFPHPLILDFE